MENILDEITQDIMDVSSIDISIYEKSFVQKIIDKRISENALQSITEYMKYLINNRSEVDLLLLSLNITYTEFFRNSLTFANLEQWIIPRLVEQNSQGREIRIWSAGCSSGQEPYSLAMLLDKYQQNESTKIRYRIIATDISESELEVARRGVYRHDQIQSVKVSHLDEFFIREGDLYSICPRIKDNVSFSEYDLLDNLSSYPQESIFGGFDLVMCNNLLFYYQKEPQRAILKKIINSLGTNGYLITGEAERHTLMEIQGLLAISAPVAIFQKAF